MQWLSNWSLKAKLGGLVGLATLGLAVFGAVAYTTLNAVKVGGNEYRTIVLHKDALADLSPPRANLMVVVLLARETATFALAGERELAMEHLQELRDALHAYQQARAQWQQHPELYKDFPFESAAA